MAWSGATAGAVAAGGTGVLACSSDDDGGSADGPGTTGASGGAAPAPGEIADAEVPSGDTIYDWISEVFHQGVRRPGYPADHGRGVPEGGRGGGPGPRRQVSHSGRPQARW